MDQSKRTTAVLLGSFVGNGCSALIDEIVWSRQMGLVLDATSVSLAILLTSFIGGMCLGCLALPYWLHARDANQSLLTRTSLDVIRVLAPFMPATLL